MTAEPAASGAGQWDLLHPQEDDGAYWTNTVNSGDEDSPSGDEDSTETKGGLRDD